MQKQVESREVGEELERKTLEFFADSMERYERCEISRLALLHRLDTLWGMASGLVPWETMDLIQEARDSLDAIEPETRHFRKGDRVVTAFKRTIEPRLVVVRNFRMPDQKFLKDVGFEHEFEPFRRREEALETLAEKLRQSGFKEI